MIMMLSKLSNSLNKIHNDNKFPCEESDEHNSRIMKFSAQHLKRKFCQAYCFGKREVFGSSADQFSDAGEHTYEWPEKRIHSKARDTHASMNLRFPVPDDKVPWKNAWDSDVQPKKNVIGFGPEGHNQSNYQPFFATENDEPNYADRVSKIHNPCGRCCRLKCISGRY